MDSHDTDRAIAKILGLTVVSLAEPGNPNKDREFAEGHLYEEPYRSRLYRHPTHAFQEGLEWSPSCNPADALAALEAWCKDKDDEVEIYYTPDYSGMEWTVELSSQRRAFDTQTLPEAICAAILAAEAAHG